MDENKKLATVQRQRTLLLYQKLVDNNNNSNRQFSINLIDSNQIQAHQLLCIDSSESKFVFNNLTTDWGTHNQPTTIRGGDLAYLKVSEKE